MFILGSTFLGADFSFSPTPTNVSNITKLKIQNAEFDTVSLSSDYSVMEDFNISTVWDNNTILIGTFDSSLSAGNVDYVLDNTSDIIIKRREKGTFDWITVYRKEISVLEDFNISFTDKYCKNNTTYQYACVGMLNGVESNYNIKEIVSYFDGIFICTDDNIYGTLLDVGSCDTTRVHYNTKLESVNKKYPSSYSFSKANYDMGSASGYFLKYDTNTGDFYPEDSIVYRNELTDFLSSNKPFILKHYDGRIWLVNADGDINNDEDSHYLHRIISFNWYESGNYNSEKDLFDSGLSDVSRTFWSKE